MTYRRFSTCALQATSCNHDSFDVYVQRHFTCECTIHESTHLLLAVLDDLWRQFLAFPRQFEERLEIALQQRCLCSPTDRLQDKLEVHQGFTGCFSKKAKRRIFVSVV